MLFSLSPVSVYGTFTHKGHPCLAMELLDFNLKEFIYRSENCRVILSSIPTTSNHSKNHSKVVSNVPCNNNNNGITSGTANHKDHKKGKGQGKEKKTAVSRRSQGRVRTVDHTEGSGRCGTRMQTRRATAQRAAGLRSKGKDSDHGSTSAPDRSTAVASNSGRDSRTHSGSLKDTKKDNAEEDDGEEDDHVDHQEGNQGTSEEDVEEEDDDEDASSYGLSLYLIQQLLRDIASCLEFVQRCGWVHGDLKPANILWSSQEGSWKIVDFGHSFQEGRQVSQWILAHSFNTFY